MSEWKPGDVGVSPSGERFLVTVEGACAWASLYDNPVSGTPNGGDRRLVILDPEDRTQVERLHMTRERVAGFGVERTQAALREFANPPSPKPEEPTGLGAVVEDDKGRLWVRRSRHDDIDDWCTTIGQAFTSDPWDRIDAVRVLSEGVTDV